MITKAGEVYELTQVLVQKCQERGYDDIAAQLDDALHLGSSALEILGAIRSVFVSESERIVPMIGHARVKEVIDFVDKSYGRPHE